MADEQTNREAFRIQYQYCTAMDAPITARVCLALADCLTRESRTGARALDWPGEPTKDALPLRLTGVRKGDADARIMEALSAVGLADFTKSYPRELSGGMKMRVSIARALVTKPKLLLMDEPFAALDEITRQKLNDDVLRLWRETGITVIFVTHSVFESAFLSNRIVVMRARPGQVYADLPLVTSAVRDENYRTSEEYRSTTDTVSRALQEAIMRGAQAK